MFVSNEELGDSEFLKEAGVSSSGMCVAMQRIGDKCTKNIDCP